MTVTDLVDAHDEVWFSSPQIQPHSQPICNLVVKPFVRAFPTSEGKTVHENHQHPCADLQPSQVRIRKSSAYTKILSFLTYFGISGHQFLIPKHSKKLLEDDHSHEISEISILKIEQNQNRQKTSQMFEKFQTSTESLGQNAPNLWTKDVLWSTVGQVLDFKKQASRNQTCV
jgi:hypothetical protein